MIKTYKSTIDAEDHPIARELKIYYKGGASY